MSIGKLEFNLPEEKEEFDAACYGMEYKCQIETIKENLRMLQKHGLDDYKDVESVVEYIRNMVIDETTIDN